MADHSARRNLPLDSYTRCHSAYPTISVESRTRYHFAHRLLLFNWEECLISVHMRHLIRNDISTCLLVFFSFVQLMIEQQNFLGAWAYLSYSTEIFFVIFDGHIAEYLDGQVTLSSLD